MFTQHVRFLVLGISTVYDTRTLKIGQMFIAVQFFIKMIWWTLFPTLLKNRGNCLIRVSQTTAVIPDIHSPIGLQMYRIQGKIHTLSGRSDIHNCPFSGQRRRLATIGVRRLWELARGRKQKRTPSYIRGRVPGGIRGSRSRHKGAAKIVASELFWPLYQLP